MNYNSKTLDELCDVKIGRTPPRNQSEWFNSGASDDWKWVSIKDMGNCGKFITTTSETITDKAKETFNYATVTSGTILLSFKLTLGRVVICDGEFVTNEAIAQLPIKDPLTIDRDYLYYYLKNYNWSNIGSTSSIATAVNSKMVKGIKINFPDLGTQKKIARILSALDQKIELINCENCTIENTLQSHFNNWIDNMKPIATVGLDEIAKYTNGLAMQKFRPGDNDLGLPVVKIKEMNSGISKDTERCTSELKEEYTVFPGDVLFAWSGTLCMKIWDGEVAGLNQHIFKVTSDEYPKWFYYFWTKKHLERFINIAKGKATTMGHIQRKELSLSKVLIPNEHELKKQDGLFKPLLEKIISNNSQRQSLIHLRDTILPKLMSGEINLDKVMTDE